MSDKKNVPVKIEKGWQPLNEGWQPAPQLITPTRNISGGYQPTTSQAPSQGPAQQQPAPPPKDP